MRMLPVEGEKHSFFGPLKFVLTSNERTTVALLLLRSVMEYTADEPQSARARVVVT